MQNLQVIRNYTIAMLAGLSSAKDQDKILQELKIINQVIQSNDDLKHIINSPIKSKSSKIEIIKSIIVERKLGPLIQAFLSLLVRNKRLNLLADIINCYENMLNEKRLIKDVEIFSAKTLSNEEKKYLVKQLEKGLNLTIAPRFKEDQSLIGGIKIAYDSKLIDLSIAQALKKINQQVKNISLEE